MQPQLLVFTDLDGTLLDHDSYAWQPAEGVLQRLADLDIPLILNSSKTAREILDLRRALANRHPYIVENGGAVCLPDGYFTSRTGMAEPEPAAVQYFGRRYPGILQILRTLRREKKYPFEGFADFGIEGIMRTTGLDRRGAERASERLCTEPILWQGSGPELDSFRRDLAETGLQLVKGGRFMHVMGNSDKGWAMLWLSDCYRQAAPDRELLTVALGDGPNDLPMLKAADIAVVIRPKHGSHLQLDEHRDVYYPAAPGPAGWQAAVEQILDRLTSID